MTWSVKLSLPRIPWRRSSILTVTLAGGVTFGTFGSVIPAGSTTAICRVSRPTLATRRLPSNWRSRTSPGFESRSTSFSLSMSTPISDVSPVNSSKIGLWSLRTSIATWEGSTAFASRPSFEMESLTSVTRVETTSTTSRRFSILIRSLNIVEPRRATHRSPLKGLLWAPTRDTVPQAGLAAAELLSVR